MIHGMIKNVDKMALPHERSKDRWNKRRGTPGCLALLKSLRLIPVATQCVHTQPSFSPWRTQPEMMDENDAACVRICAHIQLTIQTCESVTT